MLETNIVCEKRSYRKEAHSHAHPFSHLIFPFNGRMHIETPEKKFVVDENHLFFIPADTPHSYAADESSYFLVVDIPPNFIADRINHPLDQAGFFTLDDRWKSIKRLLSEEMTRGGDPVALKYIADYAQHILSKTILPVSLEYVHRHYDEGVTVKKLAEMENYNPSHYVEWFKKITGMTPNAYIQNIRFEKAKEYLLETNYSVLVIAQLVGYEHQSSLTRLFSKMMGVSPSQFRREATK